MKLTIAGKSWERRVVNRLIADGEPCDGDCLHEKHVIRICRGLEPRNEMETDIHESLHAMFPWLQEWWVQQAGRDLTALLFDKLHYRREE